jgi:PPOX class probable F420-dependent enzyme
MPLSDYADLLQRPLYAHVATVAADGTPQVTPVAFEWDGRVIRFSTLRARLKARNIVRNPRVALSIIDPEAPLRHVQIRGTAMLQDDPTATFADAITQRYMGHAYRGQRAGRVIVTVVPDG